MLFVCASMLNRTEHHFVKIFKLGSSLLLPQPRLTWNEETRQMRFFKQFRQYCTRMPRMSPGGKGVVLKRR